MAQVYDAIVIGAGQAGTPMAVRLAQSGFGTLLVERQQVGGTCVNDGCTPTKAMVASARAAHVSRRAADYGVKAGPVSVDMNAVKARKDRIVQASIDGWARESPERRGSPTYAATRDSRARERCRSTARRTRRSASCAPRPRGYGPGRIQEAAVI